MFSRLSIRARMTIGSTLVGAILLAITLTLVSFRVATILTDTDHSLAVSDLISFQKDITASPYEQVDNPGTGVLVVVKNPAGAVQVDTMPSDVERAVIARAPGDQTFTMTDDEGRTFVVVGQTVDTRAGRWVLWSARSTSASQIALAELNRLLFIGGVVLLAAFSVASWVLATVALRPVGRMRRTAEALGGQAGDGVLPVSPAKDELSDLATTLNDFIARTRASAEREKQMVSDAAHELRTPIAVLRTQLELAHDDFGDPHALAAQVTSAETTVERLASLADNLLELSRREGGDIRMTPTSGADLTSELLAGVDRARLLAQAKRVDVGFDIADESDQRIYGIDAQSFGRIVDNLLANAVTAVDPGGLVSVRLDAQADALVLEVTDDGPGVPVDFLPHAFERFSRADQSRSVATGGSGLGLSLVRMITETAGGEATLRNLTPGLAVQVTFPHM
jgi:signal transduction histidine kinase